MKSTVDKFGHYRGIQGKAGPPGMGFQLTPFGNYDMQDKQLVNVKDPTDDQDAATRGYVYKKLLLTPFYDTKQDAFSARYHRIVEVQAPQQEADAVTLGYLKMKVLHQDKDGDYNVGTKRLKGLRKPEESSEAVNKEYLEEKLKEEAAQNLESLKKNTLQLNKDGVYDVESKRMKGLMKPKESSEAVNKEYLEERLKEGAARNLENNSLRLNENGVYDVGSKRLKGLMKPEEPSEAVNKQYLEEKLKEGASSTITFDEKEDAFNAKKRCVTNLGEARRGTDAVNFTFLKSWLKIHAYLQLRELTDVVINLRREINGLHKTKRGPENVRKHLNNIEESHKRSWRNAVQDGAAPQKPFTAIEKKQLTELLKIESQQLESFLAED